MKPEIQLAIIAISFSLVCVIVCVWLWREMLKMGFTVRKLKEFNNTIFKL